MNEFLTLVPAASQGTRSLQYFDNFAVAKTSSIIDIYQSIGTGTFQLTSCSGVPTVLHAPAVVAHASC